jgi:hypothetical protein
MINQTYIKYYKQFNNIYIDDKVQLTLKRFKQNILVEIIEIQHNKLYGIILTEKFKSYKYRYGQIIEFTYDDILEHQQLENHILVYNEEPENLIKLKFILFYIKYLKYPNEIEIEEIIYNNNIEII